MYSLLLAITYLAFISLGLPDSLIGAGWPVMHGDLGVPTSYAGGITFIIAGGTILSSLGSDRLTRRLGPGLVTAISVATTAAALLGFSSAHSYWVLCLWAVPYGLGAGAVDAALNNFAAVHYAARHMNWLHAFWGIGASISPFIMSRALTTDAGWPSAYRTIGLIQVVLTVILLVSLPLWRSRSVNAQAAPNSSDAEPSSTAQAPHLTLRQAVRVPGVVPLLIAFFSYCAIEQTSMLWAATYLRSARGVDAATAAAFGSSFILGLAGGRILAGAVADRLGDRFLVRWGFSAFGIGMIIVALPLSATWPALVGFALAGVGAAPVYPSIIHETPALFGAERSQAIVGIEMAAAYVGTLLMPPLFGVLAGWTSQSLLPWYLGALVVLGLVMSERLHRLHAVRE